MQLGIIKTYVVVIINITGKVEMEMEVNLLIIESKIIFIQERSQI